MPKVKSCLGAKPKVSATGTWVFVPAEIDQVDELSSTTVLSDAINKDAPES
jgi:hypothetical protein